MTQRDVERRVAQNAAIFAAKRAEIANLKGDELAKFREAAETADRNYRLGAVPLTLYVETQKQYLELVGTVTALQKEALQAAQELEILTGLKLYGEEAHPTVRFDRARDDRELALLAAALDRGLPVLAICRGLQLLNVHLGGTLHQHLAAHPVGGDGVHEVRFAAGSVLRGLYGPRCPVNSLHHQAVATPATGLACVGHAPDGVVEAVELTGRPVIGVQWHPELLARTEPVFAWLVSAAASRETG